MGAREIRIRSRGKTGIGSGPRARAGRISEAFCPDGYPILVDHEYRIKTYQDAQR
ncbi:hypothetical protein GCM10020001_096970 [Nonomuraea salmonea]